MKSKLFLLILVAIVFASCKINKQVSVLKNFPYYNGEVKIIYEKEKLPENAELVAIADFDDGSSVKCEECQPQNYLRIAMEDARKYGANIIFVTKLQRRTVDYSTVLVNNNVGGVVAIGGSTGTSYSCCYIMSCSYYFAK